ncbi:energy-coupling factor ABC transporter permease [Acetobacterium woodii]|uniref:Cobalamin biosynthesis protein CbiM2 n=1 Tax=Acetobacterium woodii (strain ATCC 29683 / DSM 1030 / JCM 2381 / KCTC 1655 / WB1) TaxID=931626 RepID=H6LFU5_ACEWD|nr:energy-coupling factor ABC transporter permease [Acetobacterium woodii]AFA48233.1 cobalamin biosynthesis protein CbiM2 [Acetobacterium woodii DSM 1030]
MHMADALVSPAVGGLMLAASAGAVAYSAYKCKDELDEKKIPLMGVMGAVIFAGQMINFTIPGTGSSGHIGGGILLAALLGPFPAFLTITAVLLIQALFFADGGLLALGANIWNMGFYACLLIYPLVFKPIVKKGLNPTRITVASIVSVVLALSLGAFSVVLETLASGITELPFVTFVGLMIPIHLAIGLVEGIVTGGILVFVYKMRPELLESSFQKTKLPKDISIKKVLGMLLAFAVVVGGGVSLFASANPDGLEWAMQNVTGTTELEAKGDVYTNAESIQETTAFLPDYTFKSSGDDGSAVGTSISGLVGGGITLLLAGGTGYLIYAIKRKKEKSA